LDAEINAGCGTWDVDEIAENQFVEVFPNPAKDRINIRFAEVCEASVRLYDMLGRMVYSESCNAQALVIPTDGLRKGVYTVLINAGGRQEVSRVVVE
jgi:hypothetical protein